VAPRDTSHPPLPSPTGRPLLVPSFGHVSMRWVSRIPSVEECAVAVAAAARAHGVEQADVIAHSYGTLVASMLVQTKK